MNSNRVKHIATRLVLASTASLVVSCGGPGSVSPGVSPELEHSWEANFNRGNASAVVALYAPDAELVMSGSATAKGSTEIRAVVDAMIKSGAKVHIDTSQNVGAGDIAYV
jgi:hypothetical protein